MLQVLNLNLTPRLVDPAALEAQGGLRPSEALVVPAVPVGGPLHALIATATAMPTTSAIPIRLSRAETATTATT